MHTKYTLKKYKKIGPFPAKICYKNKMFGHLELFLNIKYNIYTYKTIYKHIHGI